MSASKKQMIETLKELRNQVSNMAKLKIEEASKQIDSYVKIVEEEKKRRRR